MPREVATKANALIEASYRFELLEMQVLLYGVSLVNPVNKDFPTEYVIDIKRFAEIFHKDLKNVYRELKKTILGSLWERDVTYKLDDGKDEKNRWLVSVTYCNNEGYLKVFFNPKLQPFLHQLSKNFTVLYIDQVAKFKSFYSVRIYEFAIMEINKSKNNKCNFILTLDEIKKRLDIKDKYRRLYDFRINVIVKAQSEINKYSDLTLDCEEIKQGRTVEKIKFIVKRKNGAKPAKYNVEQIEQVKPSVQERPAIPSEEEIAEVIQRNELKIKLMRYGVIEKVANQLLEDYITDRIEHALEVTGKGIEKGNVNNPAAYLVSAIKEDYQT